MAKVEIITTQVPHGSSAAGESKRGLNLYSVASEEIVFTNSTDGDIGVTKWEWSLLESPPGSSASLTGAATSQASLQADVYGRYVVALRVNDLGDNTPGYSLTVAGVSFPSQGVKAGFGEVGDWDLPAFLEGTYANWTDYYGPQNDKGAQREVYRILYQLRLYYISVLGLFAEKNIIPISLPGSLVQRSNADSTAWADAGYTYAINLADYTFTSVYFGAVLFREGSSGTARIQLYDVTNADIITGSTLSTAAGPLTLETSALTVGGSSGNMRDDANTLYKARIAIDGGSSSDYSVVYSAFLKLE